MGWDNIPVRYFSLFMIMINNDKYNIVINCVMSQSLLWLTKGFGNHLTARDTYVLLMIVWLAPNHCWSEEYPSHQARINRYRQWIWIQVHQSKGMSSNQKNLGRINVRPLSSRKVVKFAPKPLKNKLSSYCSTFKKYNQLSVGFVMKGIFFVLFFIFWDFLMQNKKTEPILQQ